MIRVAAVGDIHVGAESKARLRPAYEQASEHADVLLLAGDLTRCGSTDEAEILAGELEGIGIPVVAVLGNHDLHAEDAPGVTAALEKAGVTVLEQSSTVLHVGGCTVGVAGAKGFGGGFAGKCATEFGEPEMKAFVRHTREISEGFERALAELDTDVRVALLHYSPIPETLRGEPPEIFPFLGSYLLAEAIDRAGADVVFHGHAHRGSERGVTPGGVRVRNVAQPVIRHAYAVYTLHADEAARRAS